MHFVTVTRTNSNITLLLTLLSALAKVLEDISIRSAPM
jgi:hypothetical protein